MNLWLLGIVYELLAIWLLEQVIRAPDLPWHD
jgi:hypothetical protein